MAQNVGGEYAGPFTSGVDLANVICRGKEDVKQLFRDPPPGKLSHVGRASLSQWFQFLTIVITPLQLVNGFIQARVIPHRRQLVVVTTSFHWSVPFNEHRVVPMKNVGVARVEARNRWLAAGEILHEDHVIAAFDAIGEKTEIRGVIKIRQ